MRQDAELLPGTVGPVVIGWDHIQRKFALEFGDGLFLGPPAGGEGPERWAAEGLVGGQSVDRIKALLDGTSVLGTVALPDRAGIRLPPPPDTAPLDPARRWRFTGTAISYCR
jgi:hypothetical protein